MIRAIDDERAMWAAILGKLRQWGKLPESDLSRMLREYHLITDDFRAMEEEGFIDMTFIGDEYIVGATRFGQLFLEEHEATED